MKNFGFSGMDNVIYLGTNGKMNEVSAAMGITSLESLDDFSHINHQNYHTYRTHLVDTPGIKMLSYDEREKNNFQYIIAEIDENKTGINRNHLMKILHAENIRARRYFYPGCHRMEPYKSYFPNADILLPETEKLSERLLCLPTGTAIGQVEIRQICHVIQFVVENSAEITSRITDKMNSDFTKERVAV
jgi:dTDP-4-amino-4,6-dideoxygalactose transaminase